MWNIQINASSFEGKGLAAGGILVVMWSNETMASR